MNKNKQFWPALIAALFGGIGISLIFNRIFHDNRIQIPATWIQKMKDR